jgi:hypothetical protein
VRSFSASSFQARADFLQQNLRRAGDHQMILVGLALSGSVYQYSRTDYFQNRDDCTELSAKIMLRAYGTRIAS